MPVESRGSRGEVFLDARGNGRALRLTWHHEADVVVLSLWREAVCAGTFRLATADVNTFIDALVEGLQDESGRHPDQPPAVPAPAPATTPAQPPSQPAPSSEAAFTDWAFGPDSARANAS